jgi:hypothetical protein
MNDIAVDEPFLAKCLGLSEWPQHAPITSVFRQIAARTITDAFRPESISGEIKAGTSIYNAEAWIKRAYEMGRKAGQEEECEQWEQKIIRLFGLRKKKR